MYDWIFGALFMILFFHAVQWNLQIKGLGGKPLWFKFYKKGK